MTNLSLLEIESTEILTLAKQVKAQQKALANLKELERARKVVDLLDAISSLHPEKSNSIFKELFSLARAKDFKQNFVYTISGTINVCSYDGAKLVTFKQNGEISVKTLPYRVFVERFGADFSNYFVKGVVSYDFREIETGYDLTSSECFEVWKSEAIAKYTLRASGNYDSNLSTIYKRKLEISGLEIANKKIGKPTFKKAVKK